MTCDCLPVLPRHASNKGSPKATSSYFQDLSGERKPDKPLAVDRHLSLISASSSLARLTSSGSWPEETRPSKKPQHYSSKPQKLWFGHKTLKEKTKRKVWTIKHVQAALCVKANLVQITAAGSGHSRILLLRTLNVVIPASR